MRLLHRLNQFQRLWQPSGGAVQRVTVAELAERCFCSERHARTLLGQLEKAGWLTWRAQAGRGKRGELTFLVSPQSVRATLLEQELERGQHQNALDLAQLAPEQLRQVLQPLLGGRWQNDIPTLRIPYYRPLEPLTPGFLPGRAEQHLASEVYAGLTRFDDDCAEPIADMAHHWDISPDGCTWRFYLRPTLRWHNGEAVSADQLLKSFQRLLTRPGLAQLFASVSEISAPHGGCIQFTLHQADYWLPWRLSGYCSRLAHPDDETQGCGPFRIAGHGSALLRLENHDGYHLRHPLLRAIEFWITPQLFDTTLGTSCRHPVQLAIGNEEQLPELRPVSHSISLGFCYLAINQQGRLTKQQARWLMALIHNSDMIDTLPLGESLITPGNAILPGWEQPPLTAEPVALPSRLRLIYHLPVELHVMAQQLRRRLATLGCELEVIFHNAKSWSDNYAPADADIVMGDRLIGDAAEATLEQWLRCDPLWPLLLNRPSYEQLQTRLDAVQHLAETHARHGALMHVFHQLMEDALLTPLFHYRYLISAPPGVNGIRLNARGWFDFSRVWLPPPGA
ncbi:SgrR family transcriptional regulator [Enterobacteriaceae bacterium 4M9]|nr:SgrR family transcriptional regulator [Enterobacteriaceae bacterium 4M9]